MFSKKLLFITTISALFSLTLLPGEVRLTKSETAKLKDYLTETKKTAQAKADDLKERIESMHTKSGYDLQSDEIKRVKSLMYEQHDIINANTALLKQLESGKYTYSLVVAQLKSLGTEPQKVLNVTGLREKVLSGGSRIHPLLITIESINPDDKEAVDVDEAYRAYKIGQKADARMQYVVTQLLDELIAKQRYILDQEALKEAVDVLQGLLDSFKADATISNVLKTRVLIKGYEKLETLKKIRNF